MHVRKRFAGAVLAAALVLAGLGFVQSPAVAEPLVAPKPPVAISGQQQQPTIKAGSVNAVATQPLGATQAIKTEQSGMPVAATSSKNDLAIANIGFGSPLNYCQQGWTYTPVYNTTGATKYVQVRLYTTSNGTYHDFYTSVANGSTIYPYFLGTSGTYYAYVYVWNGSSYVYDEYVASSNNCGVTVSINTSTGYTGYVLLTVKNTGNAYASVLTQELAPNAAYGTYTGTHWLYPAAGGTVYQYYYVGTGSSNKYGILANVYLALNLPPWTFTGQL